MAFLWVCFSLIFFSWLIVACWTFADVKECPFLLRLGFAMVWPIALPMFAFVVIGSFLIYKVKNSGTNKQSDVAPH